MRIHRAADLLIVSLLASQSARAADWQVVASPNAGRQANSLSSVAAVGDNDVWAVGWAFNPQLNAYRTVTEHWNGTRWSLVRSPNATNGYNFLNGVAVVASNDVWAVGNDGSLATLAIHWDGASWSVVPAPDFDPNATNQVLIGIVALSSRDVWTAGQYIVPIQGSAQHTLTENWDGSNWNFVPSPTAQNSNNRLHGITATPGGTLWAVGTTGVFTRHECTLILRKSP